MIHQINKETFMLTKILDLGNPTAAAASKNQMLLLQLKVKTN